MINLAHAQAELRARDLDGWLLYDFQGLNPLARNAAGLAPGKMITRRWFCLVPAAGDPRWLVHAIERGQFDDVHGTVLTYARRTELETRLVELLGAERRVAMEYSPRNNVPYVSRVDAGTLELVRGAGADVRSSGDLVQALLARWPARGRELHDDAARKLERTVALAFQTIGDMLRAGRTPTEVQIQKLMVADMEAHDLFTAAPPIVAADAHSADPHYGPGDGPGHDAPIRRGSVVMLDIWGKRRNDPDAIYADMTFMGYAGETPPARVVEVWNAVSGARDAALAFARSAWQEKREPRGFEVDRASRDLIEKAGFGPYFTHRTGHSLGIEDHWIGANMDDFETHDDRRLIEGTGFTIEPGIYLPGEFGCRSEIDVFVEPGKGPVATTEIQRELVRII